MPDSFDALVAEHDDDGSIALRRRLRTEEDLAAGEVTVAVSWSGVNYKDALAVTAGGGVARSYPLVPGIDLAGTVTDSTDDSVTEGSAVLVHGYGLGTAHHGGYAQRARVPVGWVVPVPAGLTEREAMVIGTAGFTAAMSVARVQAHGVDPGDGPVLVTGATGGVGSAAVDMLAGAGYEVVASTGKPGAADWLRHLGAAEVISRAELAEPGKPLAPTRWAAAVDCVGGGTLAAVLAATRYGGLVAASGVTGGAALPTTVMPFILRGVTLAGIDSVQLPLAERCALWQRLATDLRPGHLTELAVDTDLAGVPEALAEVLAGRMTGRTVVNLDGALR